MLSLVAFPLDMLGNMKLCYVNVKGRVKRNVKKYGLLPNQGGGGVSKGGKKPNCFFEKKKYFRGGFGKRPYFFTFFFLNPSLRNIPRSHTV